MENDSQVPLAPKQPPNALIHFEKDARRFDSVEVGQNSQITMVPELEGNVLRAYLTIQYRNVKCVYLLEHKDGEVMQNLQRLTHDDS